MIALLWLACVPDAVGPQPAPAPVVDTSVASTEDACPAPPPLTCAAVHLSSSMPSDGAVCAAHGDCPLDMFCGEGQCRSLLGSMGTVCVVRSTHEGPACALELPVTVSVLGFEGYYDWGPSGLLWQVQSSGTCVAEYDPMEGCVPYDLGLLADEGVNVEGTWFGSRVKVIEAINKGCWPLTSFRTPGRVDTIAVWYP